MSWLIPACAALAGPASAAAVCAAADDEPPRPCLHLELRDTNDLTGAHDLYGIGVGTNLGRDFGIALSDDRFALFPRTQGIGTVGEYAIYNITPQLRLRHLMGNHRLALGFESKDFCSPGHSIAIGA